MRTHVNESLLKVPPKMEEYIMRQFVFDLLWMLRDRCKGFPEHRKAVLAEAKKWGIALPREHFEIPKNGYKLKRMPLDFSGMPPSYTKLTPDREKGYLVLDYGGVTIHHGQAWFWDRTTKDGNKEAVIVIGMLQLRGVDYFPARSQPDEIPFIIYHLREILDHELRHLVQHVLLAQKDPKQIAMLPDYTKQKAEYYASPIEHDAQLASAVSDFNEHCRIMLELGIKPNMKKWIKQYVGMLPSAIGNGFENSLFFKALKKHDIERYKRAVKTFVKMVLEEHNSD